MSGFQLRLSGELLQQLINQVVARSHLTDVVDGSDLKQVLAATARLGEQLYTELARVQTLFGIDRLEGPDLDRRALDYLPDGLSRNVGARAVGTLRWTRLAGASPITIPAGTRAAAGDLVYVTTEPGTIPAGPEGTGSRAQVGGGDIPAVALVAGTAGNNGVATVARQVTTVPGTLGVTNPTGFVGGTDRESDDDLRARIRAYVQSLSHSTLQALEHRARQAEVEGHRVVLARAVEEAERPGFVDIYVDDGAGTAETWQAFAAETFGPAQGGEYVFRTLGWPWRTAPATVLHWLDGAAFPVALTLGAQAHLVPGEGLVELDAEAFPDGLAPGDRVTVGAYQAHTGLIRAAQRLISGDPSDPELEGWRAAGVRAHVRAPVIQFVEVSLVIQPNTGFDLDTTRAAVAREVSGYVNGLDIGAPLIVAELIERAMGVPGMFNVTVLAPAADLQFARNHLARLSADNLEIN